MSRELVCHNKAQKEVNDSIEAHVDPLCAVNAIVLLNILKIQKFVHYIPLAKRVRKTIKNK